MLPSVPEHLILFVLGFCLAFVGTHTGGTALLIIPIMNFMGIPIQSAVANSRIASLLGAIGGISEFHKRGKIDYRLALPACLFTVVGSFAGAGLFLNMSPDHITKAVALLLLILAPLSIFSKRPPQIAHTRISRRRRLAGYLLLGGASAVGSFCGGQGLLATYVYLLVFHKTMSESVGTRKITGLAATVVSAGLYSFVGIVDWGLSFALATGSLIGAHFGSRYGLEKGELWIKRLFNAMVVLLALRMLLMHIQR